MEKLKLKTPDLTEENVLKIQELFPNCVTESQDKTGSLKRSIDFDLLKQELSSSIVEGPIERYQLNWPGKREALLTANAPIAKTLRPSREESVDFDTTQNLFIEGDNLDALKLLQETYLGKVKMIYIDPPYNTGNDFIYEDDFAEDTESYLERSRQKDEEGNRMVANTESNGRFHSDWLSMMYPRLKLARNLLRDDGVIFISIDDGEVHNLRKVCDEVFGAQNFIANLSVQLNPRGRHLDKFVARTHEQILIFGKNSENLSTIGGFEKTGRMMEEYDREDKKGRYRLLGLRNRNQAFNPVSRPNLYYPLFVAPETKSVNTKQDAIHVDEVFPITAEGIKTCWTWSKSKVDKEKDLLTVEKTDGDWRIYRKDYLFTEDGTAATTLSKSIWFDKEISNDYGKKSVKELFGSSVMDFPKSAQLVMKLLVIGSKRYDIILDFFSGSATSAHAVMQLNAEDGGNRKFIMVQLPEVCDEKSEAFKAGYKTIAEISKERIRRAGKKIKEELKAKEAEKKEKNQLGLFNEGEGEVNWDLDVGFRVLKVDTTNMKDVYYNPDSIEQGGLFNYVENIIEDRTEEDLLFQVLLDWGTGLTLPIQKDKILGKNVFFVDQNALVACFASNGEITEDFCRELADRKPLRVVFRDSGFKDDSVKINVEQIFKLMSPKTEVRSI